MDLLQHIVNGRFSREEIDQRTDQIGQRLLVSSPNVTRENFDSIADSDLSFLFDRYDELFFGGFCREALGDRPIRFRLSSRMTRVGGKTFRRYVRGRPETDSFEIAVSTLLLYQCFDGSDHRPIVVTGSVCRHRLDALQRIFEHELVHLVELLLWTHSNCSTDRFHDVAHRFFGHTEHGHRLITPRERALVEHGVRPGVRVRFDYDGQELTGIVNRVTRRATVLVEHADGVAYSDGKHYVKYYVPTRLLRKV